LLPPSETLRVLELTKCRDLTLLAPAAFPRLATLRLCMCTVLTGDLQDMFDAAPELATVHLESVFFKTIMPRHHQPTTSLPAAAWFPDGPRSPPPLAVCHGARPRDLLLRGTEEHLGRKDHGMDHGDGRAEAAIL
jgi:hypothetical protein